MNIYSVYKSTNKINGKSYIGFDSSWPTRQRQHEKNYKKCNIKFYSSIKKYGWDNFEWEVIYQSKDSEHCKNVMESYFIKEYNTFGPFGYNMTPGGDGKKFGSFESEETKKKKSLSHMGKKLSKEHIQNSVNGRKGYKHSTETIEKLRNAKLGKSPWNKGQHTGQIPWNKKTTPRKCCCIVCNKEVDYANLGRHHKHLPKILP